MFASHAQGPEFNSWYQGKKWFWKVVRRLPRCQRRKACQSLGNKNKKEIILENRTGCSVQHLPKAPSPEPHPRLCSAPASAREPCWGLGMVLLETAEIPKSSVLRGSHITVWPLPRPQPCWWGLRSFKSFSVFSGQGGERDLRAPEVFPSQLSRLPALPVRISTAWLPLLMASSPFYEQNQRKQCFPLRAAGGRGSA